MSGMCISANQEFVQTCCNFTFLWVQLSMSCWDDPMFMILGLGTENTWEGSGKDHVWHKVQVLVDENMTDVVQRSPWKHPVVSSLQMLKWHGTSSKTSSGFTLTYVRTCVFLFIIIYSVENGPKSKCFFPNFKLCCLLVAYGKHHDSWCYEAPLTAENLANIN